MSFAKSLVLFLSLVVTAHALATPLVVRHAHRHHAIAARVAAPAPVDLPLNPLRKRQSTKRCRQRPSSSVQGPASATSTVEKPTTTQAAPPPPATTPKKETPAPPPAAAPAPAPTTTQAAAPPASSPASSDTGNSGNEPSFLVGTQTGDGTFYSTGLGACGITNTDTDHIAAVSHLLFDAFPGAGANPNANPVCGRKITATYQGKSTTITVTDRCQACAITDLDFSPAAFSDLADFSVGRIHGMTWVWD